MKKVAKKNTRQPKIIKTKEEVNNRGEFGVHRGVIQQPKNNTTK